MHCSDAALCAEPGSQRVPRALQPVAEAAGRERQEYHQRQDQASHLVCKCTVVYTSRVYYECRLRSAAARSLMNKFSAGLHFFETAYRDVVTGWWAILMYACASLFLISILLSLSLSILAPEPETDPNAIPLLRTAYRELRPRAIPSCSLRVRAREMV